MSRYWLPDGAREQRERPEIGALVATRRAVFRIVEYRPYYEDQWTDEERDRVLKHGERHAPYHVVLRPAHIKGDDPRVRDFDKSYSVRSPRMRWWVYPHEHYPLCGTCGEPTPCREWEAGRAVEMAVQHMARYEDPTKCPGCLKTVTKRGKHLTLPNVVVPLGEPVTFHLRWGSHCWAAARDYERQLADADPAYNPTLSCAGHVVIHDSWQDCDRTETCPGLVDHRSMMRCRCCSGYPCPRSSSAVDDAPVDGGAQ